MQLPLRLQLGPSRTLAMLLALGLVAALGSLLPLDLPLWIRCAAGAAAAWSAWIGLRRHALLASPCSVRELTLTADGTVEALTHGGDRVKARVSSRSTVFPWLVVMLLKVPGSRRLLPVLVLPDSLRTDEFRALRSWLRWKAVEEAAIDA